jgi:hypothetical protein
MFGFSSAVNPIKGVSNVLEKIYTSADDKINMAEAIQRVIKNPSQIQGELNKIEAGKRHPFLCGWRPFIGWICGVSLFYNLILRDIVLWFINFNNLQVSIPDSNLESTLQITFILLGFGGFRTVEKILGKAK